MQRIQIDDIVLDTLPSQLRFEDRSSMAFSIEARVPLLDHKLVECGVALPDHLKVQDGWAFMFGAPRKPGGGRIDFSKTAYAEAERLGMFDDNISALLHKVRGRWTVVKYVIGATDVVYLEWDKQYRAPSGIFPH